MRFTISYSQISTLIKTYLLKIYGKRYQYAYLMQLDDTTFTIAFLPVSYADFDEENDSYNHLTPLCEVVNDIATMPNDIYDMIADELLSGGKIPLSKIKKVMETTIQDILIINEIVLKPSNMSLVDGNIEDLKEFDYDFESDMLTLEFRD